MFCVAEPPFEESLVTLDLRRLPSENPIHDHVGVEDRPLTFDGVKGLQIKLQFIQSVPRSFKAH